MYFWFSTEHRWIMITPFWPNHIPHFLKEWLCYSLPSVSQKESFPGIINSLRVELIPRWSEIHSKIVLDSTLLQWIILFWVKRITCLYNEDSTLSIEKAWNVESQTNLRKLPSWFFIIDQSVVLSTALQKKHSLFFFNILNTNIRTLVLTTVAKMKIWQTKFMLVWYRYPNMCCFDYFSCNEKSRQVCRVGVSRERDKETQD